MRTLVSENHINFVSLELRLWKDYKKSMETDLSTWEKCSPGDFDHNNIQNAIISGDAVENSLTSKLLLFTSRPFKRLAW